MAYRCPDCNRFSPVELGDPEEQGLEVTDEHVEGDVRIALVCQNCGTEIAESVIHMEAELPEDALNHTCGNVEWMVDGIDLSANEYFDGAEKTPMRYRHHFYGFELNCDITCQCGKSFKFKHKKHVSAGDMEAMS